MVPRENRAALILPPLDEAGALAAENVRLAGRRRTATLQGRSLAELARQARSDLLAAARDGPPPIARSPLSGVDPAGLIFLAGHQPELFHPGVWFKNFALADVARRHGEAAVNLLIDSDTLKSTAVTVPCGTPADPRRESVLFDRPDARIPFEERPDPR